MLQVRWSLNAATATKKKTLACDYNPIHKRLRDFGTEAHEVEALPNGGAMAKPQTKGNKKAAVEKAPPAKAEDAPAADMPPVTLQSIVAELETAGLLSKLDSATVKAGEKTPPQTTEVAETGAPGQLSLGAASLLKEAGFVFPSEAAPAVAAVGSTSSEAGNEAPASDAGSSYEGSVFENVATVDDLGGDGIDPLSFLQTCSEPLASPEPKQRHADAPFAPTTPQTSFKTSNSDAVAAGAELAGGADGAPSAPVSDAELSDGETKHARMLSRQDSKPESIAGVPEPLSMPKEDAMLMSDIAFEDLANELEGGNSNSILSELHGLYDLDDVNSPPRHRTISGDGVDADDLFMTLGDGHGDDKAALLNELSALPEYGEHGEPITFEGFGEGKPPTLSFTPLLPPKPKSKKSKAKAKASEGGEGADADGAAAPPKKKQKKAAAPQSPPVPLAEPSSSAAAAAPSVTWAPIMPASAPASSAPQALMATPTSMLPPAPKSNAKFLPGAVQTPDPAPNKNALSGKPAAGKSAGRTFSWQPIKFPVYK